MRSLGFSSHAFLRTHTNFSIEMKLTLKLLCIAVAVTAVITSCNKEDAPRKPQAHTEKVLSEQLEEQELRLFFSEQRSLIKQELKKQRQKLGEFRSLGGQTQDDYIFDPEAQEKRIKNMNWSELTKRFFLDFPLIFEGELPTPSLHDVSLYPIPYGEKRIIAYALAIVSSVKSDRASVARATGGGQEAKDRQKRIDAAVKICEQNFSREMDDVALEAIITLGAGTFFGTPAGALASAVTVVAVGTAKAYAHYSECIAQAKQTRSMAVAPNIVPPMDGLTATLPEATAPEKRLEATPPLVAQP